MQPKKSFTAKQAFIQDPELEYMYTKGRMIPRPPSAKQPTMTSVRPQTTKAAECFNLKLPINDEKP